MSELKEFDVGVGRYTEDGSPCVVAFDADQNPRLLNEKVYLKSEADKVIEDLEESHKKEVEQLLMEIVELKADYKEACDRLQTANLIKDEQLAATRHQKYKRCLAMADMNWWQANRYSAAEMVERIRGHFEEAIKCSKFKEKYLKRYHKWLELAEKFKEAECVG